MVLNATITFHACKPMIVLRLSFGVWTLPFMLMARYWINNRLTETHEYLNIVWHFQIINVSFCVDWSFTSAMLDYHQTFTIDLNSIHGVSQNYSMDMHFHGIHSSVPSHKLRFVALISTISGMHLIQEKITESSKIEIQRLFK